MLEEGCWERIGRVEKWGGRVGVGSERRSGEEGEEG